LWTENGGLGGRLTSEGIEWAYIIKVVDEMSAKKAMGEYNISMCCMLGY